MQHLGGAGHDSEQPLFGGDGSVAASGSDDLDRAVEQLERGHDGGVADGVAGAAELDDRVTAHRESAGAEAQRDPHSVGGVCVMTAQLRAGELPAFRVTLVQHVHRAVAMAGDDLRGLGAAGPLRRLRLGTRSASTAPRLLVVRLGRALLAFRAVDARALVEDEVRELVRRRGLDPVSAPQEMQSLVDEVVADYDERSATSALPPLADPDGVARSVYDAVAGFGPLQRYLDDPEVEELWINDPGRVFVARRGHSELTTTILDAAQVRDLVERMLKSSGRRVDLSSPFVDAMLPGGERLHVVIPDVTRAEWAVNIRKFILTAHSFDELVSLGTITRRAARFLEASIAAGLNIIVAGGTQAGKTTLLNCLVSAVPARERVITCEEVFELRVPLADVVAMQTRQPSLEGTGEVRLRRLVKEALRMRPDRIVVGEVRQEEALDLSSGTSCLIWCDTVEIHQKQRAPSGHLYADQPRCGGSRARRAAPGAGLP